VDNDLRSRSSSGKLLRRAAKRSWETCWRCRALPCYGPRSCDGYPWWDQPGWEPLPGEEFRRLVTTRTSRDGWVIDGNYSAVQPIVWARADTVVWLDLPRRTVMRQVTWRTVRRAVTRQELWNGNREPLANFLSWVPEKSIISWA
jgi:hypothetical protein